MVGFFSKMVTSHPDFARKEAADNPEIPAPRIVAFFFMNLVV
jgi:hypothetical protein